MNRDEFFMEKVDKIEEIYAEYLMEFHSDEIHTDEQLLEFQEKRRYVEEFINEIAERFI
jgi:hypothetical protein